MTYTDEELLQQILGDSQKAFSHLYDRYREELFVTAAKALRSRLEAEDVVQDVFLSLWKRRGDLNIQGSVPAYLHTSVRYKCIHYITKNIHRRDYLSQLSVIMDHITNTDAETDLQLKEMQQVVHAAVERMPAKMQQVYNLSRLGNFSHREIARQMDISVETVKKHIQRALQLIRRALLPYTLLLIELIFS